MVKVTRQTQCGHCVSSNVKLSNDPEDMTITNHIFQC